MLLAAWCCEHLQMQVSNHCTLYLDYLCKYLPESQGECISLLLQQTVSLLSSFQPDLHLGQSPVSGEAARNAHLIIIGRGGLTFSREKRLVCPFQTFLVQFDLRQLKCSLGHKLASSDKPRPLPNSKFPFYTDNWVKTNMQNANYVAGYQHSL